MMPDPQSGVISPSSAAPPKISWRTRLLRIALALFTFEIGLFLIIFPWTDTWNNNAIQNLTPRLQELWMNPRFRGALTGLGFANIYLACWQVIYSFRRR